MSETKLIVFLEEMESAARDLQGRLIARDTDGIYDALEKQELAVLQLSQLSEQGAGELSGLSERNPQVRGLLNRSRSLLKTNRTLARTFLQVIDQTLNRLSGAATPTYAGYGNQVSHGRSLLVNQQM